MNNILSHTSVFRVRYADTDKMGIVYNGNYFAFFETGRTELMRHFGLPYTLVEESGFMLPLVDAYVKYLSPARYDDKLEIKAEIKLEQKAVIEFKYNIKCGNTPIAQGYTRHVFIKQGNMKTVRPPKFFLDIFNFKGTK